MSRMQIYEKAGNESAHSRFRLQHNPPFAPPPRGREEISVQGEGSRRHPLVAPHSIKSTQQRNAGKAELRVHDGSKSRQAYRSVPFPSASQPSLTQCKLPNTTTNGDPFSVQTFPRARRPSTPHASAIREFAGSVVTRSLFEEEDDTIEDARAPEIDNESDSDDLAPNDWLEEESASPRSTAAFEAVRGASRNLRTSAQNGSEWTVPKVVRTAPSQADRHNPSQPRTNKDHRFWYPDGTTSNGRPNAPNAPTRNQSFKHGDEVKQAKRTQQPTVSVKHQIWLPDALRSKGRVHGNSSQPKLETLQSGACNSGSSLPKIEPYNDSSSPHLTGAAKRSIIFQPSNAPPSGVSAHGDSSISNVDLGAETISPKPTRNEMGSGDGHGGIHCPYTAQDETGLSSSIPSSDGNQNKGENIAECTRRLRSPPHPISGASKVQRSESQRLSTRLLDVPVQTSRPINSNLPVPDYASVTKTSSIRKPQTAPLSQERRSRTKNLASDDVHLKLSSSPLSNGRTSTRDARHTEPFSPTVPHKAPSNIPLSQAWKKSSWEDWGRHYRTFTLIPTKQSSTPATSTVPSSETSSMFDGQSSVFSTESSSSETKVTGWDSSLRIGREARTRTFDGDGNSNTEDVNLDKGRWRSNVQGRLLSTMLPWSCLSASCERSIRQLQLQWRILIRTPTARLDHLWRRQFLEECFLAFFWKNQRKIIQRWIWI
ncbi:hypothetical protein SCHPADRAFT_550357 [Schizopora paradoxa]|uniref:Uncharacterized protein n=1 Tax=Schizopora paradoxa TaxID=27342 RepID=A0A0H2RK01_9AGAM|nr:hypothetical protein SCHPADRAFT_550357 [Schizopora paradoxa]